MAKDDGEAWRLPIAILLILFGIPAMPCGIPLMLAGAVLHGGMGSRGSR